MANAEWYETPANVLGLADWLNDGGWFSTPQDALRFFEKPWKWTREFGLWRLWREADAANDEKLREAAVDALDDGNTAASDVRALLGQ